MRRRLREGARLFFLTCGAILTCCAAAGTALPDSGEQLYRTHCANCHGNNGEGFLQLYTPLTETVYLGPKLPLLPCIIRHGLQGEITASGRIFNQVMPGNERLSNDDIKDLITFMAQRWSAGKIDLAVDDWLNRCPDSETEP